MLQVGKGRLFGAFASAIVLMAGVSASAHDTAACGRPNLVSENARRCIAAANATSYAQAGDDSPFAACVAALPDTPPCPIDAKARADDLSQALIYLGAAFEIAHSNDTRRFASYRRVGLQMALRLLTETEASRGHRPDEGALSSLRFLIARMESSA